VKYDFIIEQSLKSTSLKRVRIKVDPKFVNSEADLSNCDGYEGYVLAECGNVPKVLVISPEFDNGMSVMDIPDQYLEVMPEDEDAYILNELKLFLLQQCNLDIDSPEAQSIITSASIEEVESALKSIGHNDDDVKVLYRKFILDENVNLFNEISIGNILKGVGRAALKTADIISTSDPNAALSKTTAAISSAFQSMTELYKKIKDEKAVRELKKIERPPEGRDPEKGDTVDVTLPAIFKQPINAKIIKVGTDTQKGRPITVDVVGNDQVDKIIIMDQGSVTANIFYYKNNVQISTPQVIKNKWPESVGLHSSGVNKRWIINNDKRDEGFLEYKNDVVNMLRSDENLQAKYKLDDSTIKFANKATNYDQLQGRLKLTSDQFNQLSADWIKWRYSETRGTKQEPETEPEPEVNQPVEREPAVAPTTFAGRNKSMRRFLSNPALQRHTGIPSGTYGGKVYPRPGTDVLAQQDENPVKSRTLNVMGKYQPKK
jgi:hypothetical protein